MSTNSDQIIKQIKHIRKSKRLSKKNCAKVLGISKETYRSIEEGSRSLTLPELELLAFYLGAVPSALLENDQSMVPFTNMLKKDVRGHYIKLRDKMIGALLTTYREDKVIPFEVLQEATQISETILQAYENGETPIPLTDLLMISNVLEIPHDVLFEPVWLANSDQEKSWLKNGRLPEFSQVQTGLEDDGYSVLIHAIKQMPAADQAHIAKIILGKLSA
jgi:transcriptional regulator with XRE-family HTH domain